MKKSLSAYKRISVIGAGGKTTLCRALFRCLPGRSVYLTTTHMHPPGEAPLILLPPGAEGTPLLERILREGNAALSAPLREGKCACPGAEACREAGKLCDRLIVEADGAKGRLVKLCGPHEPVLPADTDLTVWVVSAEALGLPLSEAVHRPERIPEVLSKDPGEPAEIGDLVLAALDGKKRGRGDFVCAVNRAEGETGRRIVKAMEEAGLAAVALPELEPGNRALRHRMLPLPLLETVYSEFEHGIAGKEF